MKITKKQLMKIIKESVDQEIKESASKPDPSMGDEAKLSEVASMMRGMGVKGMTLTKRGIDYVYELVSGKAVLVSQEPELNAKQREEIYQQYLKNRPPPKPYDPTHGQETDGIPVTDQFGYGLNPRK